MNVKKLIPAFASLLCITASAQSFSADGLSFTPTSDNEVTLSASETTTGSITIPQTVANGSKTYTVTAIGEAVFKSTKITSIELPSTIKTIGNEAFHFCMSLTEVKGTENIERIGSQAFATCRNLSVFNWPKKCKNYGNKAFTYDTAITGEIYIPAGATVGDGAFNGMSAITTLTIDGNTEYMGEGAFTEFNGLQTMNVNCTTPPSFTPSLVFGDGWDGPDLSDVTLYVPTGSKENYTSDENWGDVFGAIEEKTFENPGDTGGTETGEDERTETVLEDKISEDSTEVTLHVAEAGTLSDVLTTKLQKTVKKLTLSGKLNGTDFIIIRKLAGVNTSGDRIDGAQLESLDLQYVDIKNGGDAYFITTSGAYYTSDDIVGSYLFTGCYTLKTVVLPKYTEKLSADAFYNATHLQDITFNQNLKYIGETCFYGCNELETVDLPEKLEKLGDQVFHACSALKHVGLPKSLHSIPFGTFYFCTNLNDITLPESITSLSDYAFFYCKSLKSINIPKNVGTISLSAFSRCSSLEDFNVDADNASFKSVDGVLFNKLGTVLMNYPLGNARETYTLPESTLSVSNDAFWESNLKGITLNDALLQIGETAFYDCKLLETVTFGNSLQKIGRGAFCSNTSLKAVNIPETVSYIGESAFLNCTSLSDFTIPAQVTEISTSICENCTQIKEIHIPATVTDIDGRAFAGCTSLEKVTVDAVLPPLCYYEDESDTNTPFADVAVANVLLVVPEASIENYKSAKVWKNFKFNNTTAIDGMANGKKQVVKTVYTDLAGKHVERPLSGIYIKKEIFSDGSTKTTKTAM